MTLYDLHRLVDVITEIHAQHSEDLCWMPADVNRIFEACGLPKQDLRVGGRAAMLRNCERYVACLEEGGPWRTYAELEAENELLRNQQLINEERIAKGMNVSREDLDRCKDLQVALRAAEFERDDLAVENARLRAEVEALKNEFVPLG